ncbi:hypothetical protein Tco_1427459 [Tanacetum coccineum]
MMTARKRVGPLPTHRLAMRHSVDYSSSDDSSSDSSSNSSSETSSDSPADALSDFAYSHSSSDHSLPASPSGTRSRHRLCPLVPSVHHSSTIFERPSYDSSSASRSRKRSRSPVASVLLSSPTLRALSYARVDLLSSPKRIRSPETTTDLEDCVTFLNFRGLPTKNQGGDLDNTDDQPNVEATSRDDWFKKPERPSTPDSDWNATKTIDFRPPQTLISKIAKAEKPPLTFDELMSTPIDFSAYVMNNLKIENLTQEHLVGPAFNLLKGICSCRMELEYHFEEYRGRQVVPVNYFINNDLEYLKGGSSSRKYTTSTTKTKAAKYDDIQGIEDMVPSLWSPVKVAYDKYAIWGITHWGPK